MAARAVSVAALRPCLSPLSPLTWHATLRDVQVLRGPGTDRRQYRVTIAIVGPAAAGSAENALVCRLEGQFECGFGTISGSWLPSSCARAGVFWTGSVVYGVEDFRTSTSAIRAARSTIGALARTVMRPVSRGPLTRRNHDLRTLESVAARHMGC